MVYENEYFNFSRILKHFQVFQGPNSKIGQEMLPRITEKVENIKPNPRSAIVDDENSKSVFAQLFCTST